MLTQSQREFLEDVHFAVVSTIAADGMPHQTVMWYSLEGDRLLLNTPKMSRKHRHLQRDLRLSVCVEDRYRYITLSGTVTLNEDPEEAGSDYARLGARYRGSLGSRPLRSDPRSSGGKVSRPAFLSQDRVSLLMEIERVIANGLG